MIVTGTAFGQHDLAWLRRHQPSDAGVTVTDVTSVRMPVWACPARGRAICSARCHGCCKSRTKPSRYLTAQRLLELGAIPVLAMRVVRTWVSWAGSCTPPPSTVPDALGYLMWAAGQPFGVKAAGYRAIDSVAPGEGLPPATGRPTFTRSTPPVRGGPGLCGQARQGRLLHRTRRPGGRAGGRRWPTAGDPGDRRRPAGVPGQRAWSATTGASWDGSVPAGPATPSVPASPWPGSPPGWASRGRSSRWTCSASRSGPSAGASRCSTRKEIASGDEIHPSWRCLPGLERSDTDGPEGGHRLGRGTPTKGDERVTATDKPVDADLERLHELGYAQELHRGLSTFSNFAISFSIISILAGGMTSSWLGMVTSGPRVITIGWIVVGFFALLVGMALVSRDLLGLSDGGRPLLLVGEARPPEPGQVGLVHRLFQPARPDRGDRLGRLRPGALHQLLSACSTTATSPPARSSGTSSSSF